MKIAVAWPGIGYTCDKPLLYYGKKLARAYRYEIRDCAYTGFSSKKNMIGNDALMREAYEHALSEAEDLLSDIDWSSYDHVLFLSKSVGTAAAATYAKKHGIPAKHIYYTPLVQTFEAVDKKSGIAFHGTADPWAADEPLIRCCEDKKIPLTVIPGANHSLETGDVGADIRILENVMAETEKYIRSL